MIPRVMTPRIWIVTICPWIRISRSSLSLRTMKSPMLSSSLIAMYLKVTKNSHLSGLRRNMDLALTQKPSSCRNLRCLLVSIPTAPLTLRRKNLSLLFKLKRDQGPTPKVLRKTVTKIIIIGTSPRLFRAFLLAKTSFLSIPNLMSSTRMSNQSRTENFRMTLGSSLMNLLPKMTLLTSMSISCGKKLKFKLRI